jgi:Matrixin/PEP-CTERM motif
VTWHHTGNPGGAINDPDTHRHQHFNTLPLGVNNGADSWFANKAWDNDGTTTAFHTCVNAIGSAGCDPAFGHGFISNRVLYFFDPNFAAPNQAFHDRVVDGFNDWITGATNLFNSVGRKNVNNVPLSLGFNFLETAARPATELFIDVEFLDLGGALNGQFLSDTRELQFNINANINWYTGAAAPTVGADQQDFLTTARHEIGHAVGFGHNNMANKTADSSIMWDAAAPRDMRVSIKRADFEGVLADYTQPIPEPSSLFLLGLGIGLMIVGTRSRVFRRGGPWL